jgi:hypothetical protein
LSQAIKNFADAEAVEAGQQMQFYQQEVGNLIQTIQLRQSERQQAHAEQQTALEHERANKQMEMDKQAQAQTQTAPA